MNIKSIIKRSRWQLGFLDCPEDILKDEYPIHWLKGAPNDRWFADPFILDVTSETNVANELKRTGYFVWDFHHFKSLLHKDIGLGQWISEIIKCKGFLAFFAKDPKPFFKQYINWIMRKK